MGVFAGPEVAENGLVLALDAGNFKSFPTTTPINEHGWAEWYCFVSSTATYSIVSSGVSIVERQSNGTLTTMVATSSGPTRGTITVTAGRTYYGVGGPINLVVEDQHHMIAPLTMVGTQFIFWAARNTPGTVYVYSPFENATIKYWDNPASGGITNTSPTSTFTLNAGLTTSFSITTPVNFEATDTFYMTSTVPILASTTQTSADKTILSPASKYVYQRYLTYDATVIQSVPASKQNGCVSDPTHSVMSQSIADGAGGDTAQGLGLEFLSDRYSWGNVLSDYVISVPYVGIVTTSYWTGSAWTVWETHNASVASLTTPWVEAREGNTGVGVAGTYIQGLAANMASGATLWKWEGTVPFYLCINDSADDEFSVLGWMNNRVTTRNTNQYWVNIIDNNSRVSIQGSLLYNSSGYWTFPNNQVSNYLLYQNFPMPTGDHTISCWFRSNFSGVQQAPYTYTVNGNNEVLLFTGDATTIIAYTKDASYGMTVPNMANRWCNFVRTRQLSSGTEIYYMDGVQIGTTTMSAGSAITSGGHLVIGQEADSNPVTSTGSFDVNQNLDGDFAKLDVYNRVLTSSEIQQNFNATRGRFGI